MGTFGIIYKVTNKINGKVYIGQTTHGMEKRKYDHVYAAKTNKYKGKCREYFHNALAKYDPDCFVWEILEGCYTKESLDLAEQWYIRYYRSFVDFSDSNGYNLTIGGNGNSGVVFSDEHRMRLSQAKRGKILSEEHKQKIRDNAKINPNYGNKGRKMPSITKEKLKVCNVGKKHSKESKKKMSLAHVGNTYARGFKHSEEFGKKISERVAGKNNPMYGVPSPMTGKFGKNNHLSKKYVVTTPANEIFVVEGINYFCNNQKDKLYHTSMIKVARGKQSNHKGYLCRYYNEGLDLNLPVWRKR